MMPSWELSDGIQCMHDANNGYPPDYNQMRVRLGLSPAPNGSVEKSRLKEMMR